VERSEGQQGGGSTGSRSKKGTPQGGVASPLLANLYLHWFDALFYGPQGPGRRADVKLVRYADDFVALAKQMGSETIEFIESRLEGKFQLEINRERREWWTYGKKGQVWTFWATHFGTTAI